MNVHQDKVHWMAGESLKKAGLVAVVGFFFYLMFPMLFLVIIVIAGLMALRTIMVAENDLGYIDYVLNIEE